MKESTGLKDLTKISLIALLLTTTGCSWLGLEGTTDNYLEAETKPATEIPDGVDNPPFVDLMPIPDVIDSRGLAGQRFELELPEPLSTTFGVDQIVIRKLGEMRWVFLDANPALVWPKVQRFWESRNIMVEMANPTTGEMETVWVVSRDGEADTIYESLTSGNAWTDSRAALQNKFQLRIEPGIRNGSTEVYVTHRQIPLADESPAQVDWTAQSDNDALENKILTELAYFLGETINDTNEVSLLASTLQENRTRLTPDASRPVLSYRLDFDRAWATVGSALEDAQIVVEDLNRTDAVYFVYYEDQTVEDPGFFGRLFGSGETKKVDRVDVHRYQVHLKPVQDEVEVTVYKDTEQLADAVVAERLLKIIREYST